MQTQLSILLVEDDPDFAEAVRYILEQAGYRIAGMARSCAQALELSERRDIDLAILDMQLEGQIDGVTLGFELSAKAVAIIYLTGDISVAVGQAYEIAEDFLAKPLRSADLLAAVGKVAARSNAERGRSPRALP